YALRESLQVGLCILRLHLECRPVGPTRTTRSDKPSRMAPRSVSNSAACRVSGLGTAFVLALALGACAEDNGSDTPTDPTPRTPVPDGSGAPTGPASSPSQQPTGPTATTPMQPSGPTGTGPGGSSVPGGTATVGPSGPSGPSGPGGSGPSGPSPGAGGMSGMGPVSGGEGGATAGGEGGAGGMGPSAGGAGPSGEGGADPGPGPVSTECTRELLDGLIDDYFAALSAGDPSTLPLAAGVKFTENAEETEIGTTDFWQDAGDVKHSQRALDTTA